MAIWDLALSEEEVKRLADGTSTPVPLAPAGEFQITKIEFNEEVRTVTLRFPSVSGVSYSGETSTDYVNWLEFEDLTADSSETTLQQTGIPAETKVLYYRVKKTE